MHCLETRIHKVAMEMTYANNKCGRGVKVIGEEQPLIYQELEKQIIEIRKERAKCGQIPILTRDEFIDVINSINERNFNDQFEMEDLKIVTEFLHNIGIIQRLDFNMV